MLMNFAEKLDAAYKRRAPLLGVTEAFRIVNGAPDGFPGMTLDKFGDRYQIQFFGDELLREKRAIADAIAQKFSPVCLVVKERLSRSGKSLENPPMEVVVGRPEDSIGVVREGSAKFHIDLLDTVNPGLFLDMRAIRLEMGERAAGRRMLNLFSYTCAFSVHMSDGYEQTGLDSNLPAPHT